MPAIRSKAQFHKLIDDMPPDTRISVLQSLRDFDPWYAENVTWGKPPYLGCDKLNPLQVGEWPIHLLRVGPRTLAYIEAYLKLRS